MTSLTETVAALSQALSTLQAASSTPVVQSDLGVPPSPLPILDADADAIAQSATSSHSEVSQSEPPELTSEAPRTPESDRPSPMTQAALARRLGVNSSRISRMQSKSNFSQWSQQIDPQGIAWVFNSKTKRFYPQTDE